MVTIHSLHLLFIGIFFFVTSQVAPFQELILSFMMIIGIILIILGILFRIVRAIGLKIKKELKPNSDFTQKSFSKNYYFSYFLISLAFVFTIVGMLSLPDTGYFIENYSSYNEPEPESPIPEPDTGEFRYGKQECHYTDVNGESDFCIVEGWTKPASELDCEEICKPPPEKT